MTVSRLSQAAAPARPASPTHVPRSQLARFVVEGDVCPELLPRVLGLVARHSLVPFTIASQRHEDSLELSFDVDGLGSAMPDILLARIEAMVSVRAARLLPMAS